MRKNSDILFVCNIVLKNSKGKVSCRTQNSYISISKSICTGDVITDNGRLLSADTVEVTCTNLDYEIIRRVYRFDQIAIKHIIWANSGYLPDELLKNMLKYYERKQELKGVEGEELNYLKAKGRVNSYYGMMVTTPIHDEITLDGTEWKREYLNYDNREIIQEELDKFYKNRNNFLPYQWGVFVPAWTRYHLWIDIILPNDPYIVYCDTDSAKMIYREKCIESINRYNDWAIRTRRERLKQLGIDKDYPDLGIFDWETEKTGAVKFKTLGAKKYLVQYPDGKFVMTVAGLKKSAVKYITSFDDFAPGTIFSEHVSGRTISRFITNEVDTFDNGGCYIENTTYRLSLGREYEWLLSERDGVTVEEYQQLNSDLYIDEDKRLHLDRKTDEDDDYIDLSVILTKRNLYTVREVKRYDEI